MILESEPSVDTTASTSGHETIEDLWRREYAPMVRLARALVDSSPRADQNGPGAVAPTMRRGRTPSRRDLRTAVVNGARGEPAGGTFAAD
ncbi:MAG: hypothetical protein R2695_05750 [Acidimicrobiales bacterium]